MSLIFINYITQNNSAIKDSKKMQIIIIIKIKNIETKYISAPNTAHKNTVFYSQTR